MIRRSVPPFMVSVMVFTLLAAALSSAFAAFSDSEISQHNCIDTASLDLKVNDRDDEPWGGGVGAVIQFTDATVGNQYSTTVTLWNAGSAGGTATLRARNLNDPSGLASQTSIEIWCGASLLLHGWASDLGNLDIALGELPANGVEEVTVAFRASGGSPGDRFDFSLRFDLRGSWMDSEVSDGNLFQLMGP